MTQRTVAVDPAVLEHRCLRKRRYSDQMLAMAHAMAQMEMGAMPLLTYRCQFCGGWHLAKDWAQIERDRKRGPNESVGA